MMISSFPIIQSSFKSDPITCLKYQRYSFHIQTRNLDQSVKIFLLKTLSVVKTVDWKIAVQKTPLLNLPMTGLSSGYNGTSRACLIIPYLITTIKSVPMAIYTSGTNSYFLTSIFPLLQDLLRHQQLHPFQIDQIGFLNQKASLCHILSSMWLLNYLFNFGKYIPLVGGQCRQCPLEDKS